MADSQLRMPTRRKLMLGLGGLMLSGHGFGQAPPGYPQRPVVVRVGVPAGGPADTAIRSAQLLLQRRLGKPVLVENMPGASGAIAVGSVLAGAQDGHLLYGGPGADFLLAPQLAANARYRPLDFKLVAVTGVSDFLLASSNDHNFGSIGELLALARERATLPLSMANWGPGSAPHVASADLRERTGVRFLDVPYKGAAPVLGELAGGQVDLAFVPLNGPALGMVKTGRIKAVAVAGDRRNPALPDTPALRETAGLEGFDHTVWSAVWAPPGTPETVVQGLGAIFNEWVVGPDNMARVAANASRTVGPQTPEQNSAFLHAEYAKYVRIARVLKLQPQ